MVGRGKDVLAFDRVTVLAGILLIAVLGEILDAAWMITFSWLVFTVVIIAFLIYANTGNRYKK